MKQSDEEAESQKKRKISSDENKRYSIFVNIIENIECFARLIFQILTQMLKT